MGQTLACMGSVVYLAWVGIHRTIVANGLAWPGYGLAWVLPSVVVIAVEAGVVVGGGGGDRVPGWWRWW